MAPDSEHQEVIGKYDCDQDWTGTLNEFLARLTYSKVEVVKAEVIQHFIIEIRIDDTLTQMGC